MPLFVYLFLFFKEGDLQGRRLYLRLDNNRLQMFSVAPDQILGTFLNLDLPLSGDVSVFLTNPAPLASLLK